MTDFKPTSIEQRGLPVNHPQAEITQIELVLSTLLRTGVLTSLLVILTGTVISFVHHPGYLRSVAELPALTMPGKAMPRTVHETMAGIAAGRGQAIVMLGLLLLIATPVMRVTVSIFAFLWEKDRKFAVITTMVLMFLLLSFLLGKAGG